MLPFTRHGIDPFRDRFEIQLRGEGTVRGIGGLRVANADCETTVRNLFVAGDTASREPVAGALSGGGNVNSAWALSSGLWAGEAAARRSRQSGRRARTAVERAGQAGLRPRQQALGLDSAATVQRLQRPMLDLDLNVFRDGAALQRSLVALNDDWQSWRDHARGEGIDVLRQRETAALLATARWCSTAALARDESRGMHQRTDRPEMRAGAAHRLTVGGLDQTWTSPHPVAGNAVATTASLA